MLSIPTNLSTSFKISKKKETSSPELLDGEHCGLVGGDGKRGKNPGH
jgi:hypothetical protein